MAIDYDNFEEGEDFTASSLNSRFAAMEAHYNDLEPGAVEREGLTDRHVPGLLEVGVGTLYPNGLAAFCSGLSGPVRETYGSSMAASGPFPETYPFLYQTFSTAGATAPFGPVGVDTGGGWRIPATAGAIADAAYLSCTSHNLDDSRIKGVLVRGGITIYDVDSGLFVNTGDESLGPQPPYPDYYKNVSMIAIGWEDGSGVKHIIERSIRLYSIRAVWRGELQTSTLITQADLDSLGGDGEVSAFFVAISSGVMGMDPSNVPLVSVQMGLEQVIEAFNITVWPLHAGDLPGI